MSKVNVKKHKQIIPTYIPKEANDLPMSPGVYIMKDKVGTVIYVGKSRKLKNRVSQYFQNSKKNFKTVRMVTSAEDFEYILCKNGLARRKSFPQKSSTQRKQNIITAFIVIHPTEI